MHHLNRIEHQTGLERKFPLMPKILAATLTLLFLVGTYDTAAQSRRAQPPSGGRVNQRPAATPTPTPLPAEEEVPDDPAAVEETDVIKVATRLVTMPVRVLDRKGRFVVGLTKENFSVLENNTPQQIEHFQNEAQPFTVALVLDMSYSTVFKIEEIQSAAIAFIEQLRTDDKVMVVSFDQNVTVHCDPTSDRKEIYRSIMQTKISTGTSLYEAVDTTMNERLRSIEGRKAIVLFTDGVDTTSRESHDLDNLRDAMEIDLMIYPIRYDTFADVQAMKNKPIINMPDNSRKTTPPIGPTQTKGLPFPIPGPIVMTPDSKGTTAEEYARAEEYLTQLADRTGGRIFLASTVGNLNSAFKTIASELREFYSIGYYPAEDANPGETRRIKVRLDRENVAIRTRGSYVVPDPRSGKK